MPVAIQTAPVRYDTFRLEGGLDQITPTLALRPGAARDAVNFEAAVTGGYARIAGYERFDGRPSPSAATWGVMTLTSAATATVGATISCAGVSGVVFYVDVSKSALYYTKRVGDFAVGNAVVIGATPVGTITSLIPPVVSSENTALQTARASDLYRNDIGQVPGSGPIRGLVYLNDTLYAWRNNSGGTAMDIYKSSSSGWTAVPLGWELEFNTGTGTAIADGDSISNAAGTATGVVSRVVLSSGSTWAGGSGRLVLSAVTGTWAASDQIRVGGVQRATAAGAQSAITLNPSGRVEVVPGNLAGLSTSQRVYGADGVNRGFEFDGTTYVPIRITGLSSAQDKPAHVAVHKNYLFFSIGGSIQNSSLGLPYVWSAILGAAEIGMPEPVTAFQVLPGSGDTPAMAVYTRNNTSILYGVGAAASLVSFDRGSGAAAYSVQQMDDVFAMDDRGVTKLATTQSYGNFDAATLTFQIRPFLASRLNKVTASGLSRDKSQYRIFFSDGYGVYLTVVGNTVLGAMPVVFPNKVNVWCEGETSAGVTVNFFGSLDNGYVYKMETGPDFDGTAVSASVTLNFASQGSARILKRYRRASLEVTGSNFAKFRFGYKLGYDSNDIGQAGSYEYTQPFAQTNWDSFTWDNFVWDAKTLSPSEVECIGTAENISLVITTGTRHSHPFTVNSATLHYSPRRGIR